jgi:hypothetical protein
MVYLCKLSQLGIDRFQEMVVDKEVGEGWREGVALRKAILLDKKSRFSLG